MNKSFSISNLSTLFLFLCFSSIFLFLCQEALAVGVMDTLTDVSEFLSRKVVPTGTGIGVSIGSIMAGFGSPKGIDVVKYSVLGGAIGFGGIETLNAVLF